MNYNPYAPPNAPPPDPYGGAIGPNPLPGPGSSWTIGEVLQDGWRAFTANWGTFVGAAIVSGLIQSAPTFGLLGLLVAEVIDQKSVLYSVLNMGSSVYSLIVGAYFISGFTKMNLAAVRGEPVSFGQIFSGGDRFFSMLGTHFLYSLIMSVGICCMFLIGGIYFGAAFGLAYYFVVDRRSDPIEALKGSWQATEGQRGNIILFGLVAFAILLAGALACYVGLLVAAPVVGLASASMYRRIVGDPAGSQSFAGAAPPYPSPGA